MKTTMTEGVEVHLNGHSASATPGPAVRVNGAYQYPQLYDVVQAFIALDGHPAQDEQLVYQMMGQRLHDLLAGIRQAELLGYSRDDILQVIAPARAVHAQSPFIRRVQVWPRGYPGDFETVEYMFESRDRAAPGTLAALVEHYALTSPIVQQHRNKLAWQAARVLEVVSGRSGEARVLSVASNSARDLRSIQPALRSLGTRVYLNDADPNALAHTLHALQSLGDRVEVIPGVVFVAVGAFHKFAPYDVVLTGGLFDYLTDEQITRLLPRLFSVVAPGGRLLFTNLLRGNWQRVWMEYLGNWSVRYRSVDDIRSLIGQSGLPDVAHVTISADLTGFAGLVEITKTATRA